MITYYELLSDNTIGKSTSDSALAEVLGLTLQTEEEIVYRNAKRYLQSQAPAVSQDVQNQIAQANRQREFRDICDPIWFKIEEAKLQNDTSKVNTLTQEWLTQKATIRAKYPYV